MATQDLNTLDRVLTAHGYAIKKSSLTPRTAQTVRKQLTVSPHTNTKFAKAITPSFTVYTESATRLYVPRCWAKEIFGEPEAVAVPDGTPLRSDLQFQGKPYEYQKDIVDSFLTAGGNGLICVPCGRGKTFMAIWCAMRLGMKFLIVVDKEFLMNQWKGELESLVPGIRVGILQEDKVQVDTEHIAEKPLTLAELKQLCVQHKLKQTGTKDELLLRLKTIDPTIGQPRFQSVSYDCTIAMIQTLVQRDFPTGLFKPFGFTIFDECHHLGAANFSRALLKVQTKYMLGLSATPTRDDGLTKVFEWFLGKPVYWEKTRAPDPHVVVRCVHFETDDLGYNAVPTDYRGEVVLARLLTKIVECKERNEKICEIVKELCEDPRRRVLVLSERISHLNTLETMLESSGLSMSYYVGGMKEEVRESGAATSRILLASYAMASEAMNIKTLNTVILASPRKKVEQSTGRILRIRAEEREVQPIIVDIVDNHGMYKGQWQKRAKYYKQCAYRIQTESQNQSETEKETETKDSGYMFLDD
jgi:superfamily II DNA or RNA helicase